MARRKLIRYKTGAYHVNARTNNGIPFLIPLSDCWNIYNHFLRKMSEKYNVEINAFTLMNNHFHLLCTTPDENLDKAMNYFMTMTSKGIGLASNSKNHLYGNKYFWSHVSCPIGYAAVFKYVLRNPLRAKICNNIAEYPWTSYSQGNLKFILKSNELSSLIPMENLKSWINTCPKEFDECHFKKIFRKKEFEVPVLRETRRKINLDEYI